ncbi:D(2) dopamine receptor [Halotydeus destructor]|nr:D(2) dopamine receptor [Halotydeus destructor]
MDPFDGDLSWFEHSSESPNDELYLEILQTSQSNLMNISSRVTSNESLNLLLNRTKSSSSSAVTNVHELVRDSGHLVVQLFEVYKSTSLLKGGNGSTMAIDDDSMAMEGDEDSDEEPEYHWLFLCLIVLVFIGVLGNVLVCLAICLERRLQNATNYFLLSLSVADLLVSVLVMPIAILNEFYGYWPFGSSICNLWVTCDVLCSSSSILHMCFISVGRYIGIKNPLHARQVPLLVSRRAVMVKIGLAWLLSALITSPITILGLIDLKNVQPEPGICAISNRYFQLLGSFSAFFLPMLVMVNSYVLTVSLLSRKAKFCRNATIEGRRSVRSTGLEVNSNSELERCNEMQLDGPLRNAGHPDGQRQARANKDSTLKSKKFLAKRTISLSSESSMGICQGKVRADSSSSEDNTSWRGHRLSRKPLRMSASNDGTSLNQSSCPKTERNKRYNTQPMMVRTLGSSLQVRTEQKATKVLGLVFSVFVICWSPFFVLNVVLAILPDLSIPDYFVTTFQWLGFLSSTMNPVIYTIFNRNFRRAFRKILLCQMFYSSSPTSGLSRKPSQFDPYNSTPSQPARTVRQQRQQLQPLTASAKSSSRMSTSQLPCDRPSSGTNKPHTGQGSKSFAVLLSHSSRPGTDEDTNGGPQHLTWTSSRAEANGRSEEFNLAQL